MFKGLILIIELSNIMSYYKDITKIGSFNIMRRHNIHFSLVGKYYGIYSKNGLYLFSLNIDDLYKNVIFSELREVKKV